MTPGRRAVTSGNVLEKTVEAALQVHGYIHIGENLPKKSLRDWLLHSSEPTKRYARQVYIGKGIYKTDIYVDFYILGCADFPAGLIVECKWQQSKGSVDEKLPYVNLNIQQCYPVQTVVLIDGNGMKPGAIAWLNQQIGTNPHLAAVHTLSSFIVWGNNKL